MSAGSGGLVTQRNAPAAQDVPTPASATRASARDGVAAKDRSALPQPHILDRVRTMHGAHQRQPRASTDLWPCHTHYTATKHATR